MDDKLKIVLSADEQLEKAGQNFKKSADKIPKKVEERFGKVGQEKKEKETLRKRAWDVTKVSAEGMRSGLGTNPGFEQDAAELESGRFAGLIERRYDQAKGAYQKFKGFVQKARGKGKEAGGEEGSESPGMGGLPGGGQGAQTVRLMKVEKLELSRALQKKLGLDGKGSRFPRRPGSWGAPNGTPAAAGGGAAEKMERVGQGFNKLQIMGVSVGFVIGAALKTVSALAGMYQRTYQAQQSTLISAGYLRSSNKTKKLGYHYTGGGGSILSNEELAQVEHERARVSDGGKSFSLDEQARLRAIQRKKGGRGKGKQKGRDKNARGYNPNQGFDIRFARAMGDMSPAESARMFAELKKYSGLDQRKRGDMTNLLGESVAAGYGGLRHKGYIQNLTQTARDSYTSGYGDFNARTYSSAMGGLRRAGIRSDNTFGVGAKFDQGFRTEGNLLQQTALASYMANGSTYMEALEKSENGMTTENLKAFSDTTGMKNLSPEMRAILYKQNLGLPARQARLLSNTNVSDITNYTLDGKSKQEGEKDFNLISKQGGTPGILVKNQIAELIAGSSIAKQSYEAQQKFARYMISAGKQANATMEKLQTYSDSLAKSAKGLADTADNALKKLNRFFP